MTKSRMVLLLCTIPTSIYRGFPIREVDEVLNKNDATNCLRELIMKNEENRSRFEPISENSNDKKKFSSKSSLNPARDSGSIQIMMSGQTYNFDL